MKTDKMRLFRSKQGDSQIGGLRIVAIIILVLLLLSFIIYKFMTAVKPLAP